MAAYIETGNAAEAASSAYSVQTRSSAKTKGSLVLDRPHVLAELARRRERLIARHELSEDRVIEELRRIAFANLDDVATWGPDGVTVLSSTTLTEGTRAAVESVESIPTQQGPRVRVRLHNKLAALEALLARMTPTPAEQRGATVGVQVIIEGGPTGLEVPAGAEVRVTVAP